MVVRIAFSVSRSHYPARFWALGSGLRGAGRRGGMGGTCHRESFLKLLVGGCFALTQMNSRRVECAFLLCVPL